MKKVVLFLTGLLFFGAASHGAPKYKTAERLVTTAGTRVALTATKTTTTHVIIKARATNSGLVYVGGVDVAAANGYHLAANQELRLDDLMQSGANESFNLADVYLDAATNGDGVRIIYVTERYKP
jgi:hypothetical protein